LSGDVNGTRQTLRFPEQVFTADSRGAPGSLDMLPRLWATRKIGYLLNRIRLQGPDKETIDQVVRLSIRYGIVTPYTSYLVTEPSALGAEAQEKIAGEAFHQAQATPMESYGQAAVDRAVQEGEMQSADQAPMAAQQLASGSEPGAQIRVVGARTFILQENIWIDTLFDPDSMTAQQVVFLSDDYFDLLAARPDLGAALALGQQVIVVVDGQAYQVVVDGERSGPVILPPRLPEAEITAVSPTQQSAIIPVQEPATIIEDNPPAAAEPRRTNQPALCGTALLPLAAALLLAKRRWF
jgi:Ca-activated chloride channel homolog